jgi:hypothetical protein
MVSEAVCPRWRVMDFFRQLLMFRDFQPHNYCYRRNSGLVWLNAVSDTLIALAYFTIPFSLLWFIRKRRDLRCHWIYVLGFSPGPRLVW